MYRNTCGPQAETSAKHFCVLDCAGRITSFSVVTMTVCFVREPCGCAHTPWRCNACGGQLASLGMLQSVRAKVTASPFPLSVVCVCANLPCAGAVEVVVFSTHVCMVTCFPHLLTLNVWLEKRNSCGDCILGTTSHTYVCIVDKHRQATATARAWGKAAGRTYPHPIVLFTCSFSHDFSRMFDETSVDITCVCV